MLFNGYEFLILKVFRVANIECESKNRVAPGAKSHFRLQYVGESENPCQEQGKITLAIDAETQCSLYFSIAFWVSLVYFQSNTNNFEYKFYGNNKMIAKRVLKNSTFLSKHLVIRILTVRIGGFGKINFPNERLSPTCTIHFFYFFFQVVRPPCHLLKYCFS